MNDNKDNIMQRLAAIAQLLDEVQEYAKKEYYFTENPAMGYIISRADEAHDAAVAMMGAANS